MWILGLKGLSSTTYFPVWLITILQQCEQNDIFALHPFPSRYFPFLYFLYKVYIHSKYAVNN